MNTRKNLNTKRKGRSNLRRSNFSRGNSFDSKIIKPRGNAVQVLEKYLVLAQDANSNGDKIKAEGYYQYAEHYQRIINSNGVKNSSSENNNDNNHENNSSKNSNQLSRTERAINAKLKRFNKNSNEKDFEEKSDKPIAQKNIDKEGKTSDGVEALRAFATNIDTQ